MESSANLNVKFIAAMKCQGKCTALELADLCEVSPQIAIKTLLQLEKDAWVSQKNGYWRMYSVTANTGVEKLVRGRSYKTLAHKVLPTPNKQTITDYLVELVRSSGPVSASDLALIARRDPKTVNASLSYAFALGRVDRTGIRGAYLYTVPTAGLTAILDRNKMTGTKANK